MGKRVIGKSLKFLIHIGSPKAGSSYLQTLCACSRGEHSRSVTRFAGTQLCVALVNGISVLLVLFRLVGLSNDDEGLPQMLMFKPSDNSIAFLKRRPGAQKATPATGADEAGGLTVSVNRGSRGCPAQG